MVTPRIIVATDFSARADRAVDRALLIGRDTESCVRVVHAMDYIEAHRADWAALDKNMRDCVGDAPCETEFAYPEGSPPIAIAQAAQADDVKMLVMGPARYNSLGDFFLGTAVDYVLRNTETPVLVVKQRARSSYEHIIAGTDFSPASAHAIIEAGKMFPDAAMHVVHAWRVPFEGLQRDRYVRDETEAGERKKLNSFMSALSDSDARFADATSALVHGSTHDAVMSELETYGSALVVLGSHGTSGFKQAALGSVTSDLLRSLPADVLVVNTKSAEG